MEALTSMVTDLIGVYPMGDCNVVTKMLEVGSPFHGVSLTTKMPGFSGCVVFAYLYNMIVYNHGLGTIDSVIADIDEISKKNNTNPPWETFRLVIEKTLQHDNYHHRIISLITNSAKISRERFFPHVAKLADKLGMNVNKLYLELVQNHHEPLLYTDIVNYKTREDRKDAVYVHMVKFHPKYVKNALKKVPTNSSTCEHLEVRGGMRTCVRCGLVLGRVFEYEATFEDSKHVRHTIPDAEWLPWNARYNMKRSSSTKSRSDQKALMKNREAFHQRLDLIPRLPVELKVQFQRMWDLLVDMGFSPSGTNSNKAGAFSLRVVVMTYMVWRIVNEKHRHVFDFDLSLQRVKYLVLDDDRAVSTTQSPTWYLPSKLRHDLKFDYTANTYFGSMIVKDVETQAHSLNNRTSPPPLIQSSAGTCETILPEWASLQKDQYLLHYRKNLPKYTRRVLSNTDTCDIAKVTAQYVEDRVKMSVNKRIVKHGKHLERILKKMQKQTKADNIKAFDYEARVDNCVVKYKVINKENDPCFTFLPVECEPAMNPRLDYGVDMRMVFYQLKSKSKSFVLTNMKLFYRGNECKKLKHPKFSHRFALMNFTNTGDIMAVVYYSIIQHNIETGEKTENERSIRFMLNFPKIEGFVNSKCVRVFSQKNLLDNTPTGVLEATLGGLPLRMIDIYQPINKYVEPECSPINARLHKIGDVTSPVIVKRLNVKTKRSNEKSSMKNKRSRLTKISPL